jgi:hypothetical protein
MGDTLRFAERMNLIEMEPRDVSSTGYALANPGKEYLVLDPGGTGDSFTVTLDAATYRIEWFGVETRETAAAGEVTVERSGSIDFSPPFEPAGPAVLYLKNVAR